MATTLEKKAIIPYYDASGVCAAWSGDYLVIGTNGAGSDSLAFFRRDGDVITRLADPSTPGAVKGLAWNGDYLAVAYTQYPFFSWFRRDGDVLVALPVISQPPGDDGMGCAWNGEYLAVAHKMAPGITLYRQVAEDLHRMYPTTAVTGTGNCCAWSGDYLAVGSSTAPYLALFRLDETPGEMEPYKKILTKLSSASGLTTGPQSVAWNGDHLVSMDGSGTRLHLFKREGDNLTALPVSLPATGLIWDGEWVGDSLLAANLTAPFLRQYELVGDVLSAGVNPEAVPNAIQGVAFGGDYLVTAGGFNSTVLYKVLPPPVPPVGTIAITMSGLSSRLEIYLSPHGRISSQLSSLRSNLEGRFPNGAISPDLVGLVGQIKGRFDWAWGDVAATLSGCSGSLAAYHDWSTQVLTRPEYFAIYRAYFGSDRLELPLVSWQASLNFGERNSYVSCVIPGIDAYFIAIAERAGGTLIIKKGYKNALTGEEQLEELFSIVTSAPRLDQGGDSASISLEGLATLAWPAAKTVAVNGITYRRINADGSVSLRGNVDLRIRPGDTVTYDGTSFVVGRLSIQVSVGQESMEIME